MKKNADRFVPFCGIMAIYSDYLEKGFDWKSLNEERKKQLTTISRLRGGRSVFAYASAIGKQAPNAIDFDDLLPVQDQIRNLSGKQLDVIIETPGGFAEVVEDIVKHIRSCFEEVAVIVPGQAKSAGTIMAMAADEILMESTSALGPIDAQIIQAGKKYSAHAYLEGLEKIKKEVVDTGQLNRAYIPILQNISPGEIQNCENLQKFSKRLVTDWLSAYKFRTWTTHSTTGKPVTSAEREARAAEIAEKLCDHGHWLTHGRSIGIADLRGMKLRITDYQETPELCDAIRRYYVLLKMTFDTSNTYKIYETPNSQVYKFIQQTMPPLKAVPPNVSNALFDFTCPNCQTTTKIQANLKPKAPLVQGAVPFPTDNVFVCPACSNRNDLTKIRNQIEAQARRKIIQ